MHNRVQSKRTKIKSEKNFLKYSGLPPTQVHTIESLTVIMSHLLIVKTSLQLKSISFFTLIHDVTMVNPIFKH